MGLENFTVAQNTGHVEQASGDMSLAQIDDIERRAKAQVIEAEVETQKVVQAEEQSKGAGSSNNSAASSASEGKLYADLAIEAVGGSALRMLSNIAEFVGERHEDIKGLTTTSSSAAPKSAKTFDQHIEDSVFKSPGVHRTDVAQSVYGGQPGAKNFQAAKEPEQAPRAEPVKDILGQTVKGIKPGEDLVMRANIAESSLKDQGKDAIKSWDVKDAKVGPSVTEARQLTFGMRHSNEQAYESAKLARDQNLSMTGHIQRMNPQMVIAPNMSPMGMNFDLRNGPSIDTEALSGRKQASDDAGSYGSAA